jgi:small ligand-binding sensory domain FIST
MKNARGVALSAIAQDACWEQAIEKILAQTRQPQVDLALLFASGLHEEHFAEIVSRVRRETGASVLIGSSGRGIIGMGQEFESEPALSLVTLSLPRAILRPVRLTQNMVESCVSAKVWQDALAGILCSCHSRGNTLFGTRDHDARMVAEHFGALPLTGMFCNGSVSSEETKPMCRAFAASMALFYESRGVVCRPLL